MNESRRDKWPDGRRVMEHCQMMGEAEASPVREFGAMTVGDQNA
jgi:hypothetical protein